MAGLADAGGEGGGLAGLGRLLEGWVADGAMAGSNADTVTDQIGGANARRVYGL